MKIRIFVSFGMLVLGALAASPGDTARTVNAQTSCAGNLLNYPIDIADKLGNTVCIHFGSGLNFQAQSRTRIYYPSSPTGAAPSYSVWTAASGWDKCGSGQFIQQTEVGETSTSNSNNSGMSYAGGTYQDCSDGHEYAIASNHLRQKFYFSNFFGSTDVVYW